MLQKALATIGIIVRLNTLFSARDMSASISRRSKTPSRQEPRRFRGSSVMPRTKSKKPQAERVTTDANGLVIDIEPVEKPDKKPDKSKLKRSALLATCAFALTTLDTRLCVRVNRR